MSGSSPNSRLPYTDQTSRVRAQFRLTFLELMDMGWRAAGCRIWGLGEAEPQNQTNQKRPRLFDPFKSPNRALKENYHSMRTQMNKNPELARSGPCDKIFPEPLILAHTFAHTQAVVPSRLYKHTVAINKTCLRGVHVHIYIRVYIYIHIYIYNFYMQSHSYARTDMCMYV